MACKSVDKVPAVLRNCNELRACVAVKRNSRDVSVDASLRLNNHDAVFAYAR